MQVEAITHVQVEHRRGLDGRRLTAVEILYDMTVGTEQIRRSARGLTALVPPRVTCARSREQVGRGKQQDNSSHGARVLGSRHPCPARRDNTGSPAPGS